MLFPRMTQAQRHVLTTPATGLTVYQTDNIPGIYFNSGTSGSPLWVIAGTGSFWNLTGNAGTTAGTNFLGSTDGQPLMFKVNNQKAGYIDYASPFNTSFGYQSLNSSIYSYNSAFGYQALSNNTTGAYNTAVGFNSGLAGNFNNTTSIGANAGYQGADNQVNIGNMSVSWIGGQVG